MMTTANINIRQATQDDAPTIVAFQQAMAQETEGLTLDAELLRRGVQSLFDYPERGFYLVAEADGRVVAGLMITYEWSDWRNANF
ncbi:MAG: GNAT family N-acetyltransferase, partial [Chloroflexi bacterium]|nr:GNAT family N-acetyltransferase [Chloroflexota bacterium]